MKRHEGVEVELQIKASGQLLAPAALHPEKEPPVHIEEEGVGPGAGPENVEKRKISCSKRESEPFKPVARRYSDGAIRDQITVNNK
jgi:hypothetical protein